MTWWRSILLAGALLFIATATLTPAGSVALSGARIDFWCMACGAEGGADITLNIALFIPLGVALALLRTSPVRAFLFGLLLSISIESAQHFGIPSGRVASFSDLLTNAAGTFVGAFIAWHHARWLRPTQRAAMLLSSSGMVAIVTFLSFIGWALARDAEALPDARGTPITHAIGSSAPGFGWFHGRVTRATVNGEQYTHVGDGPMMFFGMVGNNLSGAVEVVGRDERREYIPLLSVQGRFPPAPEMMLGQHNADAELRVRLRGSRLRLPGPVLPLRNAFANDTASQTLKFNAVPELWTLTSVVNASSRTATLPISLSLGWTLFQTVVHVGDRGAEFVTMSWLFVLWLPLGYWCFLAGPSASARAKGGNAQRIRSWNFVAVGVMVMALTLSLVPHVMGIAATQPMEWMLSAAGLVTGVFFATRFQTHFSTQ